MLNCFTIFFLRIWLEFLRSSDVDLFKHIGLSVVYSSEYETLKKIVG